MELDKQIIIQLIAPYLTLYDVVLLSAVNKFFYKLNLMNSVKYIDIPTDNIDINSYMINLILKCPKIETLNWRRPMNQNLRDFIHRFPLVSFEYTNVMHYRPDSESFIFDLPLLKHLYVYNMKHDNFYRCQKIETIRVIEVKMHDSAKAFLQFPNLKEITIDQRISYTQLEEFHMRHLLNNINIIAAHPFEFPRKIKILQTVVNSDMNEWFKNLNIDTLMIRSLSGRKILPPLTNQHIKHLQITDITVDFSTVNLPLETLELYNCECVSYLPRVRTLKTDDSSLLRKITFNLSVLHLYGNLDHPDDLQYLPRSLVQLFIDNSDANYNVFPLLPKLTILIIQGDPNISDEGWRRISACPISELYVSNIFLRDSNVHYLANMPLNYLDIHNTSVTSLGIAKLKKLPLRRFNAPYVSPHHMLSL